MLRPHVSQLAKERERGVLQAELSLFFFCSLRQSPHPPRCTATTRATFLLLPTQSTKSRCTLVRSSRDKHVPFVWFCRRLPQQFLRALSNRRLVAEIPAKCTYEITRGLLERFGAKEGRRVAQLDFEMTVTRPKGFSFFSAAYEGTQAILRSSRFERNNY